MNKFFEQYHELLYNCNKPYQYVGGEFLSYNKSFEDAKVTFAFAFPDKYEIGISNLGQRILYGLVNDHPDFMADRVYAPEVDFKENLIKSGREFYSLESKTSLKNFDIIGFSLQYELSYPTVLAMMNMAKIPHRNSERNENDPIILAGGPCAYNPLPIADFIDAFLIGDGEEIILEVCEAIKLAKEQGLSRAEKIQKLAEIEGVWVPVFASPPPLRGRVREGGGFQPKIKKRIVQIDYDNALKAYPIPFCSSVHDRAIVEIRRGCGRMCRFCQPGHVNLPVRERNAEDIVKIAKELVQNTGYDEYSLLSLSSNDYSNIKEVIKELAVDFNDKKVSVSLPSQRIDGFNLELANLVQSVRKSTMTLAPEAGSQRLRDVIRKNISEEQLLDAVLTLYENGWSKIKFYFIIGLPTETQDDVDEMVNLLEKIKYQTKQLKREKDLKHGLDLTCTLSIFVPKPFTPFQWFPQADLDEVTDRIHYLKDKTKHIKGLKINYHEQSVSQIEAVLTRGDERLCDYIEKLYEKGCYLDAWGEHFDRHVWKETASEVGISLEELARREYKTDEVLPWDFIDIGVEKAWLIREYQDALKSRTKPSCETGCVNCGVCKNFKTKKVMDNEYEGKRARGQEGKQRESLPSCLPAFLHSQKYRIKLTKTGILRYFSHLDWQNTFFKALARSGLNVAFSQGFNPSMKVSLGVALPLFIESECELVDIEVLEEPTIILTGKELGEFYNVNIDKNVLENLDHLKATGVFEDNVVITDLKQDFKPAEDAKIENLKLKLEKVLPGGCKILDVQELEKGAKAIDHTVQWAEYEIRLFDNALSNFESLMYNMNKVLSSEDILLTKKNKKGFLKTTNIKPSIKSFRFESESLFIVLKAGQGSDIPALRADDLMKIVSPDVLFDIKRVKFFDENFKEL